MAGGLADLLEMHPTTLARHLVPSALPVFIDQQVTGIFLPRGCAHAVES